MTHRWLIIAGLCSSAAVAAEHPAAQASTSVQVSLTIPARYEVTLGTGGLCVESNGVAPYTTTLDVARAGSDRCITIERTHTDREGPVTIWIRPQ